MKKILSILLIAILAFSGCYKDDIEDLQKQVDELNAQLDQSIAALQQQLVGQIDSLETALNNLEESNNEDVQALLDSIAKISSDVENNAKTVFYGNLITDEDYAAYVDQGANVVTGKVVVNTQEQADIVNGLRWVGADFVTHIGTIEGVQNIGGNLIVQSTDTEINMKGLQSITGNFEIPVNENLTSVILDDVLFIAGKLSLESGNTALEKLSFAKLENVGEIYMNNQDYSAEGNVAILNDINLNGTNVMGDLTLEYLVNYNNNAGTVFTVGEVGGKIDISWCGMETFDLNSSAIHDDFSLSNNYIATFNAKSVSVINGDVTIENNSYSAGGGGPVKSLKAAVDDNGLSTLAFDALTEINGDVTVKNNNVLTDVLNTVKIVNGDITFYAKNSTLDFIAFEGLTTVSEGSLAKIKVYGEMQSFQGFNALTVFSDPDNNSGNIYLANDGGTTKYAQIASITAFNALQNVASLEMGSIMGVTQANYFEVLKSAYKFTIDAYTNSYNNYDISYNLPALDTVNYMYIYGYVNTVDLPLLTSVGQSIMADFYGNTFVLNTPELTLIGSAYSGVKFTGKKSGGTITFNAPKLASLTKFEYNDGLNRYYPTALNAELPALNSIKYVQIDFSNATSAVDASNLLTALDATSTALSSVKLYYSSTVSQKFSGMYSFLDALAGTAGSSKLYLYKDGSLVADAAEPTEVDNLQ